jgi:general stress protein YciG
MAQRCGRGFASMDPEAQRAIASMGGRAAHECGHAHEWNSEEAANAGHRGGLAAHRREKGGTPVDNAAGSPTHAARRRVGKRGHVDGDGLPSQRQGHQPLEHGNTDPLTPNPPDREPERNTASQTGDNQGDPSS